MLKTSAETCDFKLILGFELHNVKVSKEQPVLKTTKNAFEGGNMQTQYSVLGYRIDLYFHGY